MGFTAAATSAGMLNSGSNDATHNTAGWTNFSQPCDTANASEMRGLICSGGNPAPVTYGEGMGLPEGCRTTFSGHCADCWIASDTVPGADGLPNEPWSLTLPVVDCPGNNVSNCADVTRGRNGTGCIYLTRGRNS